MNNPISMLNVICMKNEMQAQYILLAREGKSHQPTFTFKLQVKCYSTEASGQSKQKAKQLAAKKMLEILVNDANLVIVDRESLVHLLEDNQHDYDEQCDHFHIDKNISNLDAVNKLQEVCNKKLWLPPVYEEIGSSGPPQQKIFTFQCSIRSMNLTTTGQGKSKKSAKKDSAEKMLDLLRDGYMDKVDDLLDRIPIDPNKKEKILKLQKIFFGREIIIFERNKTKCQTMLSLNDFLQETYWKEVDKILNSAFPDRNKVMSQYFSQTDSIIPQIQSIMDQVAEAMQCDLVLTLHPSLSQTNQYQCWCDLVSDQFKLPVLSAWGCHDKMEMARQVALSRLLIILLSESVLCNKPISSTHNPLQYVQTK